MVRQVFSTYRKDKNKYNAFIADKQLLKWLFTSKITIVLYFNFTTVLLSEFELKCVIYLTSNSTILIF